MKRETRGLFEISFFESSGGPKYPNFTPKMKIFVFAVDGAFLHRQSPFLVCKLLGRGGRERQRDFLKFAFLDIQGPKMPKLGTKNEKFRIFTVDGALLYELSPVLVCQLLGMCKQHHSIPK